MFFFLQNEERLEEGRILGPLPSQFQESFRIHIVK